jgi:hypothetical protein
VSSCSPRCSCHGEDLPLVVEPSRDDRAAAAEPEPPVRIPGLGEVLVGLPGAQPANEHCDEHRDHLGLGSVRGFCVSLYSVAYLADDADGVRGQPASERRPRRLCAGHWCGRLLHACLSSVAGRSGYPDPGLVGLGSRRRCCGRACACRVRRCPQTLHRGLIAFVSGPDALGSAGSRRRPGRPIRTASVSALLPKRAETPLAPPSGGVSVFPAMRCRPTPYLASLLIARLSWTERPTSSRSSAGRVASREGAGVARVFRAALAARKDLSRAAVKPAPEMALQSTNLARAGQVAGRVGEKRHGLLGFLAPVDRGRSPTQRLARPRAGSG